MARKKPTAPKPAKESRSPAVDFDAPGVTLDRLLGALPEQNDLAPLRQALLRASTPDVTQAWSRSSAYATFDKRILPADILRNVITEAAQVEHARIDALYAALSDVLARVAQHDEITAGRGLVAIGEAAEASENPHTAISYYEVAARFSEAMADRSVRVLALRRLARARGGIGDVDAAILAYRSSFEHAAASADLEGQIIALIGLGNIAGYQGRWTEAVEQYEAARRLCDGGYPQLRGQLAINLAAMNRELGNLEAASADLAAASDVWIDLSPADHSVWYNNRGLLALARNETDAAEAIFRQALETAGSDFDRAMVLDNLAELHAQRGELSDADTCARSAEQFALRAGSPRALAEIYTRLGKIFRLRADLNGVTFFEKAVELCRGRSYPLTEANAYLEYGIFRRQLGDTDEARSLIERARQLAGVIGASRLESAAADQLAQL